MNLKDTDHEWPFADPKNVAVFTSTQIMRHGQPILYVTHDEEDGAWQFHAGAPSVPTADAMIVALEEVVNLDPTICQLADLPYGWFAERDTARSPWKREKI
jgi:hypothetical protein